MRPLHLILAASLAANLLAVGAYFHTRRAAVRVTIPTDGNTALAQLELTPAQTNRLAETRRVLRSELGALRGETAQLFATALAKLREAKPGDTSYQAALQATGDVRRRQTLVIARELIAFREHLTPAQRELFNQSIGEWSFIETMLGLPPDIMKSPPSGPFRAVPLPSKDSR